MITEPNISFNLINLYHINGYTVNSLLRTGRTGGGVIVYAREGLAMQSCELALEMTAAECVSTIINHDNEPIYVVSIYRPPKINNQNKKAQFLNELKEILKSIPNGTKTIFCGDININLLNQDDHHVIMYENILAEYGYVKCIDQVTRSEIVMGKLTESCLDHIYVRAPLAYIQSAVIHTKISDHYPVAIAIEWNRAHRLEPSYTTLPRDAPARDPRPAAALATTRRVLDNRAVRDKLLSYNFDNLMSIDCPLKLYESINTIFAEVYNTSYINKVYNLRNRNNKQWITENHKKMLLERDRLFAIWKNEPTNMLKRINYTRYRNKCSKTLAKSKNYYDKKSILDCDKNIKKLWEKINTLLGKTRQSLDSKILNNMKGQGNEKDICNRFSKTFTEEIEDIKHNCNVKWLNRNTYVKNNLVSMRWQPVSGQDIKRIIMGQHTKKSPGCDLIRMCDLKLVVKKISPVLAKLVNLSISNHMYPDKLKEAIIRPIYKKGDCKNFSNYRPIAILSSINKIIEKCIVTQIGDFLQKNNIINASQHGFQKGRSTSTLLQNFCNEVNGHLSNKKVVVSVFFDFKKAFDTLEINTLLSAMEECGVKKPLNNWFRNYLTSRHFRVKLGDAYGDAREVKSGVPQGAGCAPLCYLMHVNSLCGVLRHSSAYMFADDLCVLRAGTDLAETCRLVQQDVDEVVKWSHDNGIVLNADKSNLLIIHSPHICLPNITPSIYTHSYECLHSNLVSCTCKPLTRQKCVTYLGIKVDENFSWTNHIEYISNKLRILLRQFYHLSCKIPTNTLKYMYQCLVDSILSYALNCYGLTFKSYIQKLETLQIRFLKLLVNKKTKNSCKANYYKLFKICKILPVSLKHKYLILTSTHGTWDRHQLLAHNHTTRSISAGKYEVPRVVNYYGDRTIEKRIPYLLNSLPADIRNESAKHKFAKSLKEFLLNNLEC